MTVANVVVAVFSACISVVQHYRLRSPDIQRETGQNISQ